MSPSVGRNSLLIELVWPKLCSDGSRKGWIRLWPAGLNWLKQIFLIFSVGGVVNHAPYLLILTSRLTGGHAYSNKTYGEVLSKSENTYITVESR